MSTPYISICIPSYKRIDLLKRLLDSITFQEYKDFDVIVTDDSPSDEVKDICQQYEKYFTLNYFKNKVTLGTPENWNEAIRKANGQWIKLMHDDDWFSNPDSLAAFAEVAQKNDKSFIFSSFTNVYFPEERSENIKASAFRLRQLKKNPVSLLSKNIIGTPSVTMYRNESNLYYDNNIKWLVDVEFYTRKIAEERIVYIDQILINVGLSESQVTAMCHNNPAIEIPEYFYFLKKTGNIHLRNIMIYDAWWRLLRNFDINNEADLQQYVPEKWPDIIIMILNDMKSIPKWLIKWGVVSKIAMCLSFYKNKQQIK